MMDTKTLEDLNEDCLIKIIDLLDLQSCINLAKASKILKMHFKENMALNFMQKKMQQFLIKTAMDCYTTCSYKNFQIFLHLCKSILSHFSHMAYNFRTLENANTAKDKLIIEFIMKSLALSTSGLDIFPPVDVDHSSNTWINHWYCYEVYENRFIFLMNTVNIDGYYKGKKKLDHEFVSAVIHHPYSVEERTLYFAQVADPICDWNAIIKQCRYLSINEDPNTYLEYIADDLKQIPINEEDKERVTPEFLLKLVAYRENPLENDDNVNNGFDENEIVRRIEYSKEIVAKSFDKFLYELSYSKCFPKVEAQYTFMIKNYFDHFMGIFDTLSYHHLNKILRNLLTLFKPIILLACSMKPLPPAAFALLQRISLDECTFTNKEEVVVLYLNDNSRIEWSYVNSFPFMNQLRIDGELLLSYFFDRTTGKKVVKFPVKDDGGIPVDSEAERTRFKELENQHKVVNLLRIRDIFDNKFEEGITLDFLSQFFLCLTQSPFISMYTNFKWTSLTDDDDDVVMLN